MPRTHLAGAGDGPLTPKQAARVLGVSEATVRRRIKDGSLDSLRYGPPPGGRLRIPGYAVARFLQEAAERQRERRA